MAREDRVQIEAVIRGLERVTERVVTKLTIDLHRGLTKATPVDTGFARANWVPRIGAAQRDVVGSAEDRGGIGAARRDSTSGLAQVLSYKLPQGQVFVTNNVFYIRYLNDGHSPQAPAGFVQIEIEKVVRNRSFRVSIADV